MNYSMKNNQLTVDPGETGFSGAALIKNASKDGNSFTNVAGIAAIKSTTYCLKANSNNQSILVSTTNYKTTDTKIVDMDIVNYYCVGLTTDGTDLFMVGSELVNGTRFGRLIKFSPATKKITVYNLNNASTNGVYAGIAYLENQSFYLISSKDSNKTLDIVTYKLGSGYVSGGSFSLINGGYAEMLQDIHYDPAHGLFVVTNQKDSAGKYTPCKNIVLLYNLRNRPSEKLRAVARFRFNLDTSKYKQFNLESVTLIDKRMVCAANAVTQAGASQDKFLYLKDVEFTTRGSFYLNVKVNVLNKIYNKTLASDQLVDPSDGTVTMTGVQTLSCAVKDGKEIIQGTKNTRVGTDPQKQYNYLYTLNGTTNVTWDKLFKYSPKSQNLWHANSMNFFNGYQYIGCAESETNNSFSIVKMDLNGNIKERYAAPMRTNAIAGGYGTANDFIIISGHKAEKWYDPELKTDIPLKAIYIGSLQGSGASAKFVTKDILYLKDTSGTDITPGTHYMQDIYYHKNYGLFITFSLLEDKDTGVKFRNDILHVDLQKYETVTLLNGKTAKMVIPDFSLVYKDRSIFSDCEFESPTLKESTGKMLVNANAHKNPAASGGGPITYDCVMELTGITFS